MYTLNIIVSHCIFLAKCSGYFCDSHKGTRNQTKKSLSRKLRLYEDTPERRGLSVHICVHLSFNIQQWEISWSLFNTQQVCVVSSRKPVTPGVNLSS